MLVNSVKIKRSDNLNQRAFISITYKGKRYKEYTGTKIGLPIKPNSCSSVEERDKQLLVLEYEFKKAIDLSKYPIENIPLVKESQPPKLLISTRDALFDAMKYKNAANISPLYKRNLNRVYNAFIDYFKEKADNTALIHLQPSDVQTFLNSFSSSNTYYMDKRRDFGVLLSKAYSLNNLNNDLLKKIERRKPKSVLHQIYDENQIHQVLDYLKHNHNNLYTCCLISYGCFLRPHIEVRKLKGKHFKNDFNEIHLSGDENKSGRIRITPIPKYVRDEIMEKASQLLPNQNLFTGTSEYYNDDYFSKAWNRHAKKMKSLGILNDKQTIYSFRHTAAVNVYKKTKDLHILQQLLGHSDMIVTLKYLRGLGVHNTEELRHVMPEL